jgi:pimeloyl-ACP methyl ester carboxylesterase
MRTQEVTDNLHQTAPTQFVQANIAGVSSSSGEVPPSFPDMGANAIAFIGALGLSLVDVLGFSIDAMVAQEIALQGRDLVRRVILVGTGPRGADMAASQSEAIFGATYDPPEHLWLAIHFSHSDSSHAAGLAFLERKWERKQRDPELSAEAVAHQGEAIEKYIATHEGVLDYLKSIRQPTLIVQGNNDVIIPTVNSCILQQNLPNAELIVYPDANHGSFYQYPELFVAQATQFLEAGFKSVDGASGSLPFPALPSSSNHISSL